MAINHVVSLFTSPLLEEAWNSFLVEGLIAWVPDSCDARLVYFLVLGKWWWEGFFHQHVEPLHNILSSMVLACGC